MTVVLLSHLALESDFRKNSSHVRIQDSTFIVSQAEPTWPFRYLHIQCFPVICMCISQRLSAWVPFLRMHALGSCNHVVHYICVVERADITVVCVGKITIVCNTVCSWAHFEQVLVCYMGSAWKSCSATNHLKTVMLYRCMLHFSCQVSNHLNSAAGSQNYFMAVQQEALLSVNALVVSRMWLASCQLL